MKLPPRSSRMEKGLKKPIIERVLDLTLEMLYLLTGEDYGPQRKPWEDGAGSCVAGGLRSPWSPLQEQKILTLTNMIIELLTGEVPIRCQDVTVHLSMEEWEYLEGHKDLYQDVVKNLRTITLLDIGETAQMSGRSHNPTSLTVKSKSDEAVMIACFENVTEEPASCEEAGPNVCTPTRHTGKYLTTHLKDELFLHDGVILTNNDIYTPTSHRQQDVSSLKEESVKYDGEGLSDTDIYSPTRYLPTGDRGDSAFSIAVNKPQECSECDLCFTSMIGFVEHQLIHTTEKSYTCPECKKAFGTDSDFVVHLRIHQGDKKFACAECGKRFKRRTHLSMHEKIHTGERPYLCKECGKCFIRHSYFVIHQRIHTGEKPYSCSECQKRFTSKPELVSHQRIHTGEKPFLCTECGKCFNSNKSLYRHRMSHTGERPFPCTECGKCFTSRRNLSTHLRGHTGEKPFSCEQCGKFFTCKRNLQAHQRLHTGEKPFYCAACKMRFTNKPQLVRHQQAHTHHIATVLNEDILMTVVDKP